MGGPRPPASESDLCSLQTHSKLAVDSVLRLLLWLWTKNATARFQSEHQLTRKKPGGMDTSDFWEDIVCSCTDTAFLVSSLPSALGWALKVCISQQIAASKPHRAQKVDPSEDLAAHCGSAHLPCSTSKTVAFLSTKNDQSSCPIKYWFEFCKHYPFKAVNVLPFICLLVGFFFQFSS